VLKNIGIDIYFIISFIVVNLISWLWAADAIQSMYHRRFKEKNKEWHSKLDLNFGKQIGRLERIFYIYSVMFGQFSLLNAWVILKAFFGWTQKTIIYSKMRKKEKEITIFYSYLYGNALSLLAGLSLAHFGLFLYRVIELFC